MLGRRIRVAREGLRQYPGDADAICRAIVRACDNGTFFQTSAGHFNGFYCRDFGLSAEGLIKEGRAERVRTTLDYALSKFRKAGRVTTNISPSGRPMDVYTFAPDSLAFLARAMRMLGDEELVAAHQDFLDAEAQRWFDTAIDRDTGLVRKRRFSSMKDHSIRESSCYNNSMAGMLASDLETLGLHNPLKQFDYRRLIKKHFWNGTFFEDDLSREGYVAGDANTFPFYCGVFDDGEMFSSCLKSVQEKGLDAPFPLRYVSSGDAPKVRLNWASKLAPGYETDSIWAHLGLCFISAVKEHDKKLAGEYLKRYKWRIEEYRNFLEVFSPDGTPYHNFLYYCDDSMIWAAAYLGLR